MQEAIPLPLGRLHEEVNSFSTEHHSLGERHFYIFHGNFNVTVPKWAHQLRHALHAKGIPDHLIHVPHLKHPLANYRLWRRDSGLPNSPEESRHTTIIGHSSGAQLALLYAEHHKVNTLVLYAPSDSANTGGILGFALAPFEKASGMFTREVLDPTSRRRKKVHRELQWERIVQNAESILVIGSKKDKYVPEKYAKSVFQKLHDASQKVKGDRKELSERVQYLSLEGVGHIPHQKHFGHILPHLGL